MIKDDNNMFGKSFNEDNIENVDFQNMNNNYGAYEGQQEMQTNQQMGYQGQQGMYPNQQMGYQGQQGMYPNQQMGYQGQQGMYPNQQMGYQGQQGMQANQQIGYQGQQGMYPNQQMGYQNQQSMQFQGMMNQNDNMQMQNNDFDMSTISEYKQRLRGMKEVQDLTGEVEIQNPNSIVMFGQKASENISKVSDELLKSMKAVKAEEASEMLVSLTKIMDKFDVKELESGEKQSIFSKLVKGVGNSVAKIFQKYDTMGYEVEKVYVLLKKYENDIRESNANLKKLYDANLHFYQLLEKYIVAGELALEEIDAYISQISMNNAMNQEEKQMLTQKLEISKEMLSQRVYDLQIAENVAIQAAPMIQTIQMSNFNLMRKINSSFIVTLPIFKQCLAQAVILKRQEIQAKSIKQLDDKTNELIMRNAQNTARQSVEIAKMASGSSVAISTLEKSFETIMKGIEDTKAIQEANRTERIENSAKLERIKHSMKKNIAQS
ncbi:MULTISPECIES: toxic anion resistance protein [unclassified Clostridium]|uniref:toxic anion resistance protein n=1 Tax=Clostridium TaxID=1485 RepID=UPI001C8C4742|nr:MULTISPECIES: toxic anion resistance protein [unclassified Clostridium]MDU2288538.1 toxic anion resistance protein [Clostridium celatum]MDU4324101.1 toxic anion resistance protein [Clostridium celatum]